MMNIFSLILSTPIVYFIILLKRKVLKSKMSLAPKVQPGPIHFQPVDEESRADNGDIIPQAAELSEDGNCQLMTSKGYLSCIIWILIILALSSVLSVALISSISGAADNSGFPVVFLAAVVIPVATNLSRSQAIVYLAINNQISSSIYLSLSSSVNIGIFILPLLVLIGWMGNLDLQLAFGAFEAFAILLSIIIGIFITKDGYVDWLSGLSLFTCYWILSIGFWVQNTPL